MPVAQRPMTDLSTPDRRRAGRGSLRALQDQAELVGKGVSHGWSASPARAPCSRRRDAEFGAIQGRGIARRNAALHARNNDLDQRQRADLLVGLP